MIYQAYVNEHCKWVNFYSVIVRGNNEAHIRQMLEDIWIFTERVNSRDWNYSFFSKVAILRNSTIDIENYYHLQLAMGLGGWKHAPHLYDFNKYKKFHTLLLTENNFKFIRPTMTLKRDVIESIQRFFERN